MEAAASPSPSRRLWKRRLRLIGCAVLILYLVGCAALYFWQDALLFPGRRTQGTPDAAKWYVPDTEKVQLASADGTPIVARFRPASENSNTSPTVLFFYGNAMCAAWCDGIVDQLHELGCNVLVPDYEGFGQSGGSASEAHFYATADAAWAYLQNRPGVDPNRVFIMGWSIGSAVAIDLASRTQAAGLITLSAFTSLGNVAQRNYPIVPTRLLLHSTFDNLGKVSHIPCRTLLFHGRLDTLVAPDNADSLAAAFGSRGELIWLDRADHNTMFEAEPATLTRALTRFLANTKSAKQIPRN